MNTTLTIKIPKKLRDDAKRAADELGIPLTTVVNSMLRKFSRDKEITFSVYPSPRPEKIAEWERISDEMDRGIGVSGPFDSVEGLTKHMDEVRHKYHKLRRKK